jgi:hypothetical protein
MTEAIAVGKTGMCGAKDFWRALPRFAVAQVERGLRPALEFGHSANWKAA